MRAARGILRPWLLLAGVAAAIACSSGEARTNAPPRRTCGIVAWYVPERPEVDTFVVASFDGWSVLHPMTRRADGYRVAALSPPPGEHQYAILEGSTLHTDPTVPTTAFARIDGALREVTPVEVGRCDAPLVRVAKVEASATGEARIEAQLLAASDGAPIDPSSVAVTDRAGAAVPVQARVDADTGAIALTATLPAGKHRLAIAARDVAGRAAEGGVATVWIEPRPWDWRDAVVYQVVVDRYRSATGDALPSPSPLSARAGGHVDGVRRAIESGEIAALGANTIWLSPLDLNPEGQWPGGGDETFSSYHGYWPIAPRALEPRVASEASLDALVAAAHARGVRVLFDVVPNHVHEQHPYVAAHAAEGWFHGTRTSDGRWVDACTCGAPGCDWGAHGLSCWFAPYLPDVDHRNLAATRQVTDDVLWWLDRFDGDGVRIDAVPMMPRAATRRIAAAARARWDHEGHRTMILGEIFTGADGHAALRYFLGPGGLDSAFDFPLMWALRASLAERTSPMTALEAAIRTSEAAWSDTGAVMSRMLGNHDVSRFASAAVFDGGRNGFDPAPQPDDPAVYERMGVAFGILFGLGGAPTVYYGDEIGLAGGGDPDSRRVMPGEASILPAQRDLRALVRSFGKARACLASLRRGTYRTLAADAERLVFARELPGETEVIVAAARDPSSPLASVELPAGDWVDALGGAAGPIGAEPPRSVRYYVPAGSPCAR